MAAQPHGMIASYKGDIEMEVVRFKNAESYEPEESWKRVSLCNRSDISIEYFQKPPGHASPLHDHPSAQVLVVLDGALTVVDGEGTEETLGVGDAVYFPGGESHIVKNPLDETSTGIDIFVPGRSFDFWTKRNKGK